MGKLALLRAKRSLEELPGTAVALALVAGSAKDSVKESEKQK